MSSSVRLAASSISPAERGGELAYVGLALPLAEEVLDSNRGERCAHESEMKKPTCACR